MKALSIGALALGVGLAFAGANQAKADLIENLNTICGSGVCTTGGSLGTVDINVVSTSQIIYTFNLTNGAIWDSGITTAFADVTGTISNVAVSGTNIPACSGGGCTVGTWGAGNTGTANFDGLGTGWDAYANCSNNDSLNCGTKVTLTVTGSNLGVGFVTVDGIKIFAGLDITCDRSEE